MASEEANPQQSAPPTSAQDMAALLTLCEHHGIAAEYHDIWGTRCVVPEHGLRALLRAQGVEAGSSEQLHRSLSNDVRRALEQGKMSPLPPIAVFWSGVPPFVLALQVAIRDAAHRWVLIEEGGAQHRGKVQDYRIVLPSRLPTGYHRLELRVETSAEIGDEVAGRDHVALAAARAGGSVEDRLLAATLVVVAPRRCYQPPALKDGARVWGTTVQLYGVRSERNWGMGDFTDLAQVLKVCAKHGAAIVGINPIHALFPHNPLHTSPYSPSSRRFFNVLYIDVEAVQEYATCIEARARVLAPEFQGRLRFLRHTELVDYAGVSGMKMPILELLYNEFRKKNRPNSGTPRALEFAAFQAAGGIALRQHAIFEALQEHFHMVDNGVVGWTLWSLAYRDPDSATVTDFARRHAERVEFYEYLQWQAELQLSAAGAASMQAHLGVGLYQDLAVSVDRNGADSWAAQDLYAHSASAGCPPDDFNLHGQDWGLLPMLPERLKARAYAPFIATLRACMRHAGALRIDHVMGLARLFWVPRGDTADAGSYVRYPFEHLLAIVTLESQRNACMIVGEDLGTVPDEVRTAMRLSQMFSYRVMYFCKRSDGEFLEPKDYPPHSLVTSATHDLATLTGWWEGRDLELRTNLNLFPSEEMRVAQIEDRKRDCERLLRALKKQNLLPAELGPDPTWPIRMTPQLSMAVQEYLARSASGVMVVQLEDVFGCRDQVNLPGTVEQYPNWRRKLPVPIERWEEDGRFVELAQRLSAERKRAA